MIPAVDATAGARGNSRWPIGAVVVLSSFLVLAQGADRLEIAPAYDDYRLSDEIYSNAGEWRAPPAYESEWRAEKPKEESRIHFGYDSAYEEMAARDYDNRLDTPVDFGGVRSSAQLRIEF